MIIMVSRYLNCTSVGYEEDRGVRLGWKSVVCGMNEIFAPPCGVIAKS